MWSLIGRDGLVSKQPWPSYDEKYTLRDEVTLAIQINGKVRGEIVVTRGSDEKYVLELAKIMKRLPDT